MENFLMGKQWASATAWEGSRGQWRRGQYWLKPHLIILLIVIIDHYHFYCNHTPYFLSLSCLLSTSSTFDLIYHHGQYWLKPHCIFIFIVMFRINFVINFIIIFIILVETTSHLRLPNHCQRHRRQKALLNKNIWQLLFVIWKRQRIG